LKCSYSRKDPQKSRKEKNKNAKKISQQLCDAVGKGVFANSFNTAAVGEG
jgi:hypothetical protein